MKPELPFAMCFSFPRAMLGSTQLAQCLDMSPVYTTGSFACIGTREYLGGLSPGWEVAAGGSAVWGGGLGSSWIPPFVGPRT